ncbi:carboxylesterase [Phaeosphaeria sp. MPI-PUGE-AT-0046c]|nr:carboxylesterase [Phaeosphaeria sp. MPI-PUGE-AT-0046c]
MSFQTEPYLYNAGALGRIEGLTISANDAPALNYFGGIPYALPPIGTFRFRAPRKLPRHYRYGTTVNPGRFAAGAGICPQPKNRNPPNPALFDENCLQLNIWIPAKQAPEEGWPVLFYIHGGYLQWGSPNWGPKALAPLLGESAFEAIVVMPAYRLNALGFLTGQELAHEASENNEPVGNMGFWDQRTALEWVSDNISYFTGNPQNITVGGYSAGALSAFHQLAHELYHEPQTTGIIRRLIMFSNAPGIQPKTLQDHQSQFDEFIARLNIPVGLKGEEKLERLRAMPYQKLIDVQSEMEISEFRAVSDGIFCSPNLFQNINNGDFAQRMKRRNITLISGECRDEHTMYRHWRTPQDSYLALYKRLCGEYPEKVSQALLQQYCGSTQMLPSSYRSWQELFGHIYADVQVHNLQRGFHNALFVGGLEPGKDVMRYRFDRRLKCVDATIPVEWGVTHSSDVPIWFWGTDFSGGLTSEENAWLKGWNKDFSMFVRGEIIDWGTRAPAEMKRWRSDGDTDIWEDDRWQEGIDGWKLINGAVHKSSL